MAKLQSRRSGLQDKIGDKRKDKEGPVTTVTTRKNTTGAVSPTPFRLTADDKAELNQWVMELQEKTGKRLTGAKVLRGLIHMRDKINQDKLIDSIKDIT